MAVRDLRDRGYVGPEAQSYGGPSCWPSSHGAPEQLLEHVSAAVRARVPALEAAAGGPHRGQVVTGHAADGGEVAARYRAVPSVEGGQPVTGRAVYLTAPRRWRAAP